MGNYYGLSNSNGSMMFSGNSSIISASNSSVSQPSNSSNSLLLDSVPGLKHDTGLAVEWTPEEQYKLEESLIKFAEEPRIMRYIKIAATLRDKTVRDVALRCRWMTRKRRKQEESHSGRKLSYRKDKPVESSSKASLPCAPLSYMTAYPQPMHQLDQNERVHCQALSGTIKQLLEQNVQVFGQISTNLSCLKLQDNIDLLRRTRENISQVCSIMKEMPGRMKQMRDLPVSINQELADNILSQTSQSILFGLSSGGVQPKQESRC